MNKRDEIREGLKKIAYRYTCTIEADEFLTDEILNYLHSQGVVIGVPCASYYPTLKLADAITYYTTEPLIDEDKG